MQKSGVLSFAFLIVFSVIFFNFYVYAADCENSSECEGSKYCYYGECLWPPEACDKAHKLNTLKGWETYLEIYKTRGCNEEAEEQIKIIKADKKDCAKVRRSGTAKSWTIYLEKYPKGQCSTGT